MAENRLAFHPFPSLQWIDRRLAVEGDVVIGVQVLIGVAQSGADHPRGFHPLDQVGVDLLAAIAELRDQLQRLEPPRPFLVHLRGRLDEVPFKAGSAVRNISGAREQMVQRVAKFVHQRFELSVLESLAIEIRHQHGVRGPLL